MIVVSDNLRITLPAILSAVENMDPTPIRDLIRRCVHAGVGAVDVNSGPLSKGAREKMNFLVRTVQEACDLPLFIDTVNPEAMEAGLVACHGRGVINGVSLEPEKLSAILPLAVRHDVHVIAYLLDEKGHVPPDAAGRMEVAVALFAELEQAGIAPARIIFDPVVAPLVWQDGNRQNMAVLEVIRSLPDLLGVRVRTIAGLSNLTTGAPNKASRAHYQAAFLPMLAAAGTDMILMNTQDPNLLRVAAVSRSITGEAIFSWVGSAIV